MVSKIRKRTPTKSIKDRRQRRKSQAKNASAASSAIIDSINRSFLKCRGRLLRLFSKLTRLGTPNRRRGFKVLSKSEGRGGDDALRSLVRHPLFIESRLPPLVSPSKHTVFLDLDETLVHSSPDPPPARFDFVVRPRIDGELLNFYVLKRPGVEEFLEALSERFEVVVFTAGLKEYASMVLDRLDRKSLISHRLYRDSCKEVDGRFVKDLSDLGRDLSRVVIVDDNPNSYSLQPENAIPIRPFIEDLKDRELSKLMSFFKVCDFYDDVRDAVNDYLAVSDEKFETLEI